MSLPPCDNPECPVGCPDDHALPCGEEPPIRCGTFGGDWVHDWWSRNRRLWGRYQQVRKGTRVRCPVCAGRPTIHGAHACPVCVDGFLDRDEAISHCEMEMEMAGK